MKTKTFREKISFYQDRFGYQLPQINPPLNPDTKMIVVIPCFDEPDLLGTLESLAQCFTTQYPVEVIIVINQGIQASTSITQQNDHTYQQALEWITANPQQKITFCLLKAYELPKKYAGVGLARKIGMDEALYRFGTIDYDGAIVCLDADCRVAQNYLQVLEDVFLKEVQSASIYFEHRLDISTELSQKLHQGIIQYELFLRYYVEALRFAGYPYAYHTIGSSMAARASVYALSGGMNRRKAGEDFYFLHKVAPLAKYYEITETSVLPSSRTSHRVPFGTGKAQQKWLDQESEELLTYDPQTFVDLKAFLAATPQLFQINEELLQIMYTRFPTTIQEFFKWDDFSKQVREINKQTANRQTFLKRWFHWLDGLKVLKFVHFVRDHHYPEVGIETASNDLLRLTQREVQDNQSVGLLKQFQSIDRSHQGFVDFMKSFV